MTRTFHLRCQLLESEKQKITKSINQVNIHKTTKAFLQELDIVCICVMTHNNKIIS